MRYFTRHRSLKDLIGFETPEESVIHSPICHHWLHFKSTNVCSVIIMVVWWFRQLVLWVYKVNAQSTKYKVVYSSSNLGESYAFNLVIKFQVILQYLIPYITFTMFIVHMSAVITAFGHHAQILRPVSAVSRKNHFLVEVGVFIIIITAVSWPTGWL